MTLPLGYRNEYTGNGSTADYDYTFKIRAETDLVVTVLSPLGAETELVLTTDYTVSGVGESAGGQISLVDAGQDWIDGSSFFETGWDMVIRRVRPLTQETDIRNQGDFYPESIEDEFDNIYMILQQHQEELDRAVKLEVTSEDDPDAIIDSLNDSVAAAQTAQAAAETAETNAETAETNAESAQTAAEAAQAAAEAAAASIPSLASQAEAEAGTDNVKYISSLRAKQAIDALSPVRTSNAVTLTNKRITPRTDTVASSATPTINTDTTDFFTITALATAITSFTTNLSGTPTTGQKLTIRIKDDGTARAIAWGASFASRGVTLPTTTVLSKTLYVGFIWNEVASTWDCVASSQEA